MSHSDYYFIVVILKHQRLQKVWNELFFDFVRLNLVKDFKNGLNCLYPHVGIFVVKKLVDLWQIHFFESFRAEELFMIRLQVLLHEFCTLSPNLVVCILTHAENKSHDDRFFIHVFLTNVLCHY